MKTINIPTIFNNNFTITQFFGQNLADYSQFGMIGHNGVDFIPWAGESWDIQSVSDGFVIEIGFDEKGFGNFIKIKSENRIWLFAHLSEICVGRNQSVKIGQKIGIMGNTGNSTGSHLHLGLKIVDNLGNVLDNQNGYFGAVDPLPFLIDNSPVIGKSDIPKNLTNSKNPNEPTSETWQKLETICSLEHFRFVKDAVQNSDWNWFLSSYADRYLEKKNLEIKNKEINEQLTKVQNEKTAELEKAENEFDFSTAFKNTSQNLESLKSEQILKIEPKESFKIDKDTIFGWVKNNILTVSLVLGSFGYTGTQDQIIQSASIAAPIIAFVVSVFMEKIYKLNLKK